MVIGFDSIAQAGNLVITERHIGGPCTIPDDRADNGDYLVYVCSDPKLPLGNKTFWLSGALPRLHNVGVRLNPLVLSTSGVEKPKTVDLSGSHLGFISCLGLKSLSFRPNHRSHHIKNVGSAQLISSDNR